MKALGSINIVVIIIIIINYVKNSPNLILTASAVLQLSTSLNIAYYFDCI